VRRAAPTGRCRRNAVLAGGLAGALALAGALTGDPAPVRRARTDPGALGLLRGAADAARRVPYEGRRFLTTRGGGRAATSRVVVSHTPGAGIRYRSGATGEGYRPESAAGDTTGFTPATLALLTRNYAVVRAWTRRSAVAPPAWSRRAAPTAARPGASGSTGRPA
jgi:sigma-E factor negative regulatory protein RseB